MDTIPVFVVALGTTIICLALGAAGPLLLRRIFDFEHLHCNNEVAGVKFGALAAFYSVLLAFVVVVVWTGYTDAASTCQQEAANCQNLFRLSHGLDISQEAHTKIEQAVRKYIQLVVEDEWPAMSKGKFSMPTVEQFHNLSEMVITLHREPGMKDSPGALNVQAQMLSVYTQLSVDRHQRLLSARTDVPGILWLVLIFGAFAALVFGCFFGSPNVYAQATMNALVSMILGLILLAIFLLDNNFAGEQAISPEPFRQVLKVIDSPQS